MPNEKQWPKPGDRLVHHFRKREGEVVAEVLSVDKQTGKVAVRVGDKTYATLSAAALRPRRQWLDILGPQEAGEQAKEGLIGPYGMASMPLFRRAP